VAFDQVLITDIHHYSDRLFSFRTERPASHRFTAGEFNMLTLDGKLKRAYSYTSGPYDEHLEFYSINMPDGAFTSQLSQMEVGDEIMIGKKPTGSLLMTNLTAHKENDNLWLFATGTGIAPFISILRDPYTYEQFNCIFVVWSVSHKKDLQAFDEFLGEEADILYIPVVTQEPWANNERITTMLKTDNILKHITPDNARIMLCGNMSFNEDMKEILEDRGFVEGTRNEPGTFVLERAFVES
jgi:ferredoxin--NADP+ reductase